MRQQSCCQMCKYLLITVAILQAWRSARSHSSGSVFDRGLPLNLSSTLTAPGFLPSHWCPGLRSTAPLYPGSSTGAPGKNVKDISHCGLPHLLFLAKCLLCFAYHNQINVVDAQDTCKPSEAATAARDHQELSFLDLKAAAMKLIGAFK